MTYEESLKQLEDIVRKMEAGEFSIDELAEKLTLAQQLISQCREKRRIDTRLRFCTLRAAALSAL